MDDAIVTLRSWLASGEGDWRKLNSRFNTIDLLRQQSAVPAAEMSNPGVREHFEDMLTYGVSHGTNYRTIRLYFL